MPVPSRFCNMPHILHLPWTDSLPAVHLVNIMVLYLLQGRRNRIRLPMPVVIRRVPGMFVANSDWIPLAGAVFWDDPEVSCVPGLDFIEIVCLADKPEIRGREKPLFLSAEHYGIPLSAGRKLPAVLCSMKPSVNLSCSLPLLQIMESAMHPLFHPVFLSDSGLSG